MPETYNRDDGLPEQIGRLQRPESTCTDEMIYFGGAPANDTWAMIAASAAGDVETIASLTDKNPALVNANFNYHQPLHFAVRGNQVEAVRILLERGANVLLESRLHGINQTLKMAKDRGNQEIYDLLDADRRQKFNYHPAASQISDAIMKRCIGDVRELLDDDKSLAHVSDETGNQPIHWAVMTGQMAMIDLLLQYGADVNIRRFDGACPLDLINGDYWYWKRKDIDRTEVPEKYALIGGYLIARGAEYDLRSAARFCDLGRMKQLLQKDPDLAKIPPTFVSWGYGSPMSLAASSGREDIVKFLLDYGADPNMREGNIAPQGSALYDAVNGNHMDLVKLLLDHGADPNAAVESAGNVIGGARGEMLELLVSYGAVVDPEKQGFPQFTEACESGDASAVREMISTHPELGRNQGELECAAVAGQREVVNVFMEMNPDLWEEVSVHRGEPDTLRWMLDQGMNPNLTNWTFETPLHRAASRNEPESLQILLECGGQPDVIEGLDDTTPLGLAAREGYVDTARVLLKAGADPNLAGAGWARPLALAQSRGHTDLADLLKENGAESLKHTDV